MRIVVAHCGDHELRLGCPPTPLFMATHNSLLARWAPLPRQPRAHARPGCTLMLPNCKHATKPARKHNCSRYTTPASCQRPVSCYVLRRVVTLAPLRSLRQASLGFPQAPAGHVAVCFMTASGIKTLLSWNQQVPTQCPGLPASHTQP